jgi:hypothetical protein
MAQQRFMKKLREASKVMEYLPVRPGTDDADLFGLSNQFFGKVQQRK